MSLIIIGRESQSVTARQDVSPMTESGGTTEFAMITTDGPIIDRVILVLFSILELSEIVESLIITFSPMQQLSPIHEFVICEPEPISTL